MDVGPLSWEHHWFPILNSLAQNNLEWFLSLIWGSYTFSFLTFLCTFCWYIFSIILPPLFHVGFLCYFIFIIKIENYSLIDLLSYTISSPYRNLSDLGPNSLSTDCLWLWLFSLDLGTTVRRYLVSSNVRIGACQAHMLKVCIKAVILSRTLLFLKVSSGHLLREQRSSMPLFYLMSSYSAFKTQIWNHTHWKSCLTPKIVSHYAIYLNTLYISLSCLLLCSFKVPLSLPQHLPVTACVWPSQMVVPWSNRWVLFHYFSDHDVGSIFPWLL